MINEYKNVSYSFRVQSAEDFYNQLRAYNRVDIKNEQEIDVSTCDEAKDMLKNIGIKLK